MRSSTPCRLRSAKDAAATLLSLALIGVCVVLLRPTGPAWYNTFVVVLSEFGLTFRENGNRGTDHGHGSVYWVLGGSVRGGRVAGEQVSLTPTTLNQNRDYAVLTNYRDLLGGLFSRLWGLGGQHMQEIFPGSRPQDLRLV